MKIGIFTDSYLPYTSGVVRSIQTFTEELSKLGHEAFIFAPSYKNCSKESKVFRFTSIPSPTNPDFTLAVPISLHLRPTIKQLNLDLIHVHSPFLLGRLGARCARKMGLPLVFTYHTLYDQYVHYVPFAKSFTKELAQKISKDFCNLCDLVIVPTGIIGDYLHEIGVSTSIRRVPTGIKVDEYRGGDHGWLRKKFNVPADDKVLLFVGRLGQEKNIGFLIESFKIINREMQNSTLVLVGGGPEEEELKNKASVGYIGGKVIFTGTLPFGDVINCYAGSDLFVFSSVSETQGIVIAEAKAAGLPVVAVDAFGVSEMVNDGVDGYLTKLDSGQFAETVCKLLKNNDIYHEMSEMARVNSKLLSSVSCANKLLDCYTNLLNNNLNKNA